MRAFTVAPTLLAPALTLLALTPPEPNAQPPLDHAAFDQLLRQHVRDGLVDYDAFAAAPSFGGYLRALAQARPASWPEPARLAYWINVYNAYTIRLVNHHGERESIRNINKLLGLIPAKGPWNEPIVRADERTLTLDQVEHEILRREFREPRLHFAIVCAALSCPPLRSEAYVAERLDRQLDEQARLFLLATPTANRVDVAAGTVHWSPIFDWFQDDFGGSPADVGRFIARFHPPGPARELLLGGQFQKRSTPYDWSLNSQPRPRPRR